MVSFGSLNHPTSPVRPVCNRGNQPTWPALRFIQWDAHTSLNFQITQPAVRRESLTAPLVHMHGFPAATSGLPASGNSKRSAPCLLRRPPGSRLVRVCLRRIRRYTRISRRGLPSIDSPMSKKLGANRFGYLLGELEKTVPLTPGLRYGFRWRT